MSTNADTIRRYMTHMAPEEVLAALDALVAENEQLREALEATRADISRRLAGDSAIDAPFDEDFGDALNRIDRVLAVRG